MICLQNDGCLNYVDVRYPSAKEVVSCSSRRNMQENDEVLISGFGRKGKAKGDIPGVRL